MRHKSSDIERGLIHYYISKRTGDNSIIPNLVEAGRKASILLETAKRFILQNTGAEFNQHVAAIDQLIRIKQFFRDLIFL
jgi:hypothetical protein